MNIWKYEVPIQSEVQIAMQHGAVPLFFGLQGDIPTLWAKVDPTVHKCKRKFRVVGTGHDIPEGVYVGTVQVPPFVWHLFDSGLTK